jgi:hypothetical protein
MRRNLFLLFLCSFLLSSSTGLADSAKSSCALQGNCRPICGLEEPSLLDKTYSTVSGVAISSIVSFVPQIAAMAFTRWKVNNAQLGLDVYRGIRCFELGVRGLQRLYDYVTRHKQSDSEQAVSRSLDLSLNQDMFGYLLADTLIQTTFAGMRTDLLVHHVMGLTLWGSTLFYGVLPDIVAVNSAVEILSALKGVESSINSKLLGDKTLLRNQRILKVAYAFRLAVILGIRYPMWLYIDWPVPDERYEQLGRTGWTVYRSLNVGILALETLWLYQTARAFSGTRFF